MTNSNFAVDIFKSSLKRNQNKVMKPACGSCILSKRLLSNEQRNIRSRHISLCAEIFVQRHDNVRGFILSNLTSWVTPPPFFFFFSLFKLKNLGEAEYVVALFMYMCLLGYPADKISILTTYNGQKHLIRDVINQRCGNNPLIGRPNKVTLKIYQSLEWFWFVYF